MNIWIVRSIDFFVHSSIEDEDEKEEEAIFVELR